MTDLGWESSMLFFFFFFCGDKETALRKAEHCGGIAFV